jgi:hypothetical protein
MAGISRFVHPQSAIEYGRVDTIAADLRLRFQETPTNGSDPGEEYEPKALWFTDPDGETHVYPLDEMGRQKLLEKLTGGIVIASIGGG